MAWARFDDAFVGHPKVAPRSSVAFRLCVTAIVECSRHLTDGAIARDVPATWPAAPRGRALAAAIAELVTARLWEVTPDGWAVHDYLDWNPSAADVRAKRELRSEAGSKGGKRSAEARASGQANAKQMLEQMPSEPLIHVSTLSRPVPASPVPSEPEREIDRAREASPTPAQTPPVAPVPPGSIGTACERVSQELRAITGRAWPSDAHVQAFGWIAQQPPADWAAVRAGIAADPWSRQYPSRVTPKHIVASWPKYLTPDPAGPLKSDADAEAERKDERRRADIAAQTAKIDAELRGDAAPTADELRALTARIGRALG